MAQRNKVRTANDVIRDAQAYYQKLDDQRLMEMAGTLACRLIAVERVLLKRNWPPFLTTDTKTGVRSYLHQLAAMLAGGEEPKDEVSDT